MNPGSLTTRNLSVRIGSRILFEDLGLNLRPGSITAILGINGSGKTTLLHTLAGLLPHGGGELLLNGKPVENLSRRQIATQLGLLLQNQSDVFPLTVLETVRMGRFPWSSWWYPFSEEDDKIAKSMLARLGLSDLANRFVQTLSGGERQRLAIAMLLTQTPPILLLDEPGNHLDIKHQMEVMTLLANHVGKNQATLAFSTHDLNLASRFADEVLLLYADGKFEYGTKSNSLISPNIERLYGYPVLSIDTGGRRLFFPE